MNEQLLLARNATAAGVKLLQTDFLGDAKIAKTLGKDIKTLADIAVQECILSILSSSDIPVLAEETPCESINLKSLVWIVDPLDGTLNFSRGFPMAAVSIALWDDGRPLLGVIHDIFSGEVYYCQVKQGAWLDNQEINVSTVTSISQAILATGFPSGRSYDTNSLLRFVDSVQEYKKVRALGSAALMLAQVAAGRFDAYEEEDIYLWDVAAGLALVQAAGGRFEMHQSLEPYKYYVRASNGHL